MKIPPAKLVFIALVFVSLSFLAYMYSIYSNAGKPVFVFAYGGNLEKATFASRSGSFENAAPARLEGFALVFQTNRGTAFGVANIVKDGNASVPGAIYTLDRQQAHSLDAAMGVPDFYRQIAAKATLPDGTLVDVETYLLAGTPSFAPPSRPIVEAAAKGLEQFGYGAAEEDSLAKAAAQ